MFPWMDRLRRCAAWWIACGGDLLFPPRCIHCEAELFAAGRRLCGSCSGRLAPILWNGCLRCGAKMPEWSRPTSRCPSCQRLALHFDATVPLGAYHGGLNELILRMKQPSQQAVSKALGALLMRRRGQWLRAHQTEVVVPVPMFWTRRWQRGVNSPDVLADVLGIQLGLPVRKDVLVQCRETLLQHYLPPSRRFQNMRGAFLVRRSEAVRGRRVLLVDDVLTTGATCSEAAKVLKRAGATAVVVAVIARTQR